MDREIHVWSDTKDGAKGPRELAWEKFIAALAELTAISALPWTVNYGDAWCLKLSLLIAEHDDVGASVMGRPFDGTPFLAVGWNEPEEALFSSEPGMECISRFAGEEFPPLVDLFRAVQEKSVSPAEMAQKVRRRYEAEGARLAEALERRLTPKLRSDEPPNFQ